MKTIVNDEFDDSVKRYRASYRAVMNHLARAFRRAGSFSHRSNAN